MYDSGLKKAKVSNVYPGGHSVDLVFYEDGARASNVKVLCGDVCTNRSGNSGLHAPDNAPGGQWDINDSGTTDIQAVVGFMRGVPFVVGFLYPQDAQVLFTANDFTVYRHPSDVYWTVDKTGNFEFFHPSGMFFKVGSTNTHTDLTGTDFNKLWNITKNTGTPVQFTMGQADNTATINVAANGAITVTSTVSLNFTAPAINAGSSGETLQSLVTQAFETLFNNHVHGSSGAGAPTTPMTSSHLTTVIKGG